MLKLGGGIVLVKDGRLISDPCRLQGYNPEKMWIHWPFN
jgi:hypothetical protein